MERQKRKAPTIDANPRPLKVADRNDSSQKQILKILNITTEAINNFMETIFVTSEIAKLMENQEIELPEKQENSSNNHDKILSEENSDPNPKGDCTTTYKESNTDLNECDVNREQNYSLNEKGTKDTTETAYYTDDINLFDPLYHPELLQPSSKSHSSSNSNSTNNAANCNESNHEWVQPKCASTKVDALSEQRPKDIHKDSDDILDYEYINLDDCKILQDCNSTLEEQNLEEVPKSRNPGTNIAVVENNPEQSNNSPIIHDVIPVLVQDPVPVQLQQQVQAFETSQAAKAQAARQYLQQIQQQEQLQQLQQQQQLQYLQQQQLQQQYLQQQQLQQLQQQYLQQQQLQQQYLQQQQQQQQYLQQIHQQPQLYLQTLQFSQQRCQLILSSLNQIESKAKAETQARAQNSNNKFQIWKRPADIPTHLFFSNGKPVEEELRKRAEFSNSKFLVFINNTFQECFAYEKIMDIHKYFDTKKLEAIPKELVQYVIESKPTTNTVDCYIVKDEKIEKVYNYYQMCEAKINQRQKPSF